jgi:hypothetical protein
VAFLTGAAAAQNWTWATTLALICAFCGFQAEHPLVLQIKQRRSLKPRFLAWGGLYGTVALAIALYLSWHNPLLWWIYLGAIAALALDAIAVFEREQKSIANEFITFAAVGLSAIFAYTATTGNISPLAVGLWALDTLYFSTTIFTVKLRKSKTNDIIPSLVERGIASAIVAGLYISGIIPAVAALAFTVALVKWGLIIWQREWYCQASIQYIAMLETGSAVLFLAIAVLSLLPARLPM